MTRLTITYNDRITFHVVVIILATAIATCGLVFKGPHNTAIVLILLIQTLILILLCAIHIVSVINYSKFKNNCRRIRQEYLRVVNKQTYKLNRLSETEQVLLNHILTGGTINEISKSMQLTSFSLFHCVNQIRQKLEIPVHENPFDVDWKSIFG